MERSKSLKSYYWKRFLRLFPGLILVLILTVVFSFFIYNGTLNSYLINKSMWTYLPNNLSLYNLQFGINGVFHDEAINGSLWTIRYEFSLYILISILFLLQRKKKLIRQIIIIGFFLLFAIKIYTQFNVGSSFQTFGNSMSLNLSLFFISGALLASIQIENCKFKISIFFSALSVLFLSFYFNLFFISQYLFFPIIIILFGVSSTIYIRSLKVFLGDISYGIYIYGFPIQMSLMYFFHLNLLTLMAISLLISFLFGILSWHLIEKRALNFKNINLNKPRFLYNYASKSI